MTVRKAGEAASHWDGIEAMSTGSEVSEEGSDNVFHTHTAPSTPSAPSSPTKKDTNKNSPDSMGRSYDSSLAQILQLHRALAQAYTGGTNLGRNGTPQSGRTVQAFSADLGCISNHNKTYNRSLSEPSTPTSPTLSDGGYSSGTNGQITPRTKNFKFHLATISENLGNLWNSEDNFGDCQEEMRPRCHSLGTPVHRRALEETDEEVGDDEEEEVSDGDDDYGFLSHYSGLFVPSLSLNNDSHSRTTGMHKSPVSPRRLLPKRWRKSKWASRSAAPPAPWTAEGSHTWSTVSGRRVTLTSTSLVTLSNVERLALQKISLAKLQAMALGCPINVPKESSVHKRSKRSAFSLKRKTNQDSGSGWVFGIPLSKVNSNDLELRRRKPSSLRERRESLDLANTPRHARKSSSSSVSSRLSPPPFGQHSLISLSISGSLELLRSFSYPTGAMSSDSLSESDSRSTGGVGSTQGSVTGSQPAVPGQGSNLLDALSLSSSAKLETSWRDQRDSLRPHTPQVPFIVRTCCKHLETYGLHVLGIFRIGSSKKRIKQLREEFDCGRDVKLNEDHNPHDVGGLLKEFFRDLPDPLLTRYLYSAFLATRKLHDPSARLSALRLLVALLPAANRDTLWALLSFLSLVQKHSSDSINEQGNKVAGNKMDAHNLATLFGPNVMHKAKGGEFEVTSVERAEDRHDVIAVVKEMIENHIQLFEVPVELYNDVVRLLMESNPETADYILRRRATPGGLDTDTEVSSGYAEESDSSSIQRSPSYSSENDSGLPRSSGESSKDSVGPSSSKGMHSSRSSSQLVSSDPPPQLDMLKIPQFRISSPEQGWYRPDSRSPSPMSPRISPSPKAMKSATPDLRIRIVPDSPRERASSTNALIYPRPVRFRQSLTTSTGIPSSSLSSSSSHMLTVPPAFGGLKRDRDSDSSSSLSSYYMSSSRSATNSPITPDAPHSWSMDTPPASPCSPRPQPDIRGTSSRQRPLGMNVSMSPRLVTSGNHGFSPRPTTQNLQQERWRHWERIAQDHSDEYQEQETLV